MTKNTIAALLSSSLIMSAGAFAQTQGGDFSSGAPSSGSFGYGIDTFASNTPGANTEKKGGLANAIEKAMSNNADCGKLKCD